MSSSLYRRMGLDTSPLKMYGFRRAPDSEIDEIVERVTKPTYNVEQYNSDRRQYCHSSSPLYKNRSENRLGSPGFGRRMSQMACKKMKMKKEQQQQRDEDKENLEMVKRRGLCNEDVQKIVRRVQMPTLSVLAARGVIKPPIYTNTTDEDDHNIQLLTLRQQQLHQRQRPVSAPIQRQQAERASYAATVRGYARPTTASRSRVFCTFCNDAGLSEYHDTDFSEGTVVESETLDAIINRLQTPTFSTQIAQSVTTKADTKPIKCKKRKPSVQVSNNDIPLLSGLNKTKNIDEITNRLYSTPTFVIPTRAASAKIKKQSMTPEATKITQPSDTKKDK